MIYEPDIIDKDDRVGCRQPLGGGYYWQIQKRGFAPGHEAKFNASTTRQTINRRQLLEFSWHRGPCSVLGVPMSCKTLQSFVERLEGDELDARAVSATDDHCDMLMIRQGAGMAVIFAVTFTEADIPPSYTLSYDKRALKTQTQYREDIAEATNRADYAEWVDACANGPDKIPKPRDFEHAAGINGRNPALGAPVSTMWFDDEGYGPNRVEVMIDGLDVIGKDGLRRLSRSVAISIPGTVIKGRGSFNVKTLTQLIANLTTARKWMLEGRLVDGCECGICHPRSADDALCEPARAKRSSATTQS